jgi:hypothetical protein
VLVRCGAEAVAFVDDDVPVPLGQGGDVVAPREGGQQRDVHRAGELASAAAELTGLDAEELFDADAPLVGQGFAVDENQGGGVAFGDHSAGHDGPAGARWGYQNPVVVGEKCADRVGLLAGEFGGEYGVDLGPGVPCVRDGQP